ncbi:MAG TPA: hypothetical protein VIL16_12525 [Trebonia sp.]
MAGTFDGAAIADLMAAVKSVPASLGPYRSSVLFHEPKAAPTALPTVALWAGPIEPIGQVSGLSEVSGRVTVMGRIYAANAMNIDDKAEELLLKLTSDLLGAFAGAFTLNGSAMCMDLLGAYGQKLSAVPGYLAHDASFFRVSECTFPIIVDPLWTEAP